MLNKKIDLLSKEVGVISFETLFWSQSLVVIAGYSLDEDMFKLCYLTDWFYFSHLEILNLINERDSILPILWRSVSPTSGGGAGSSRGISVTTLDEREVCSQLQLGGREAGKGARQTG